jgi:hypothetical protein
MNDVTYTQEVKGRARRVGLEHAVRQLTGSRSRATVIRGDRLRATLTYASDYLIKYGFPGLRLLDLDSVREDFLAFHRESIGRKKPSQLKVLYLCGPEPVNDLRVLLDLGCRAQNIWALEKEASYFASAVAQLREDGSFVRVHHGSLHSFFEQFGDQFDLVYYDACGPFLGGKPNTIRAILSLFAHDRLADLSALVTNFACYPVEKDDAYAHVMGCYFAPRYNDVPKAFGRDYDPADAHGEPMHAIGAAHRHLEATYSDFITRLVSDLARSVVPWAKIGASPEVMRKFFSVDSTAKDSLDERGGRAEELPLLTFLRDARDDRFANPLISSLLDFEIGGRRLFDCYQPAALLERAYSHNFELASAEMMEAFRTHWIDSDRQYFCDIPMPNLIFSMLAGVYSRPHFVNPEGSVRFTYRAKATKMFGDVFLLDRCRSLFDYVPSVDLLPAFFESAPRQLVLRACIDQVGWHDFSSDATPFIFSALGGVGEHRAAYARDFGDRFDLGDETQPEQQGQP